MDFLLGVHKSRRLRFVVYIKGAEQNLKGGGDPQFSQGKGVPAQPTQNHSAQQHLKFNAGRYHNDSLLVKPPISNQLKSQSSKPVIT